MARKKRSSVQKIHLELQRPVQVINERSRAQRLAASAVSAWGRSSLALRALLTTAIANGMSLARRMQKARRSRLLLVKETVPLGDKRFIALVGVGDEQFLIGGAANSVSLLSRVERPEQREALEFRDLLQRIQPKGVIC